MIQVCMVGIQAQRSVCTVRQFFHVPNDPYGRPKATFFNFAANHLKGLLKQLEGWIRRPQRDSLSTFARIVVAIFHWCTLTLGFVRGSQALLLSAKTTVNKKEVFATSFGRSDLVLSLGLPVFGAVCTNFTAQSPVNQEGKKRS